MSNISKPSPPADFLLKLVTETQKLIGAKSNDVNECKIHMLMYTTQFLCLMLLRTLAEKPSNVEAMSKDEIYAFTSKNYREMKNNIAEAVSAAFDGAMTQYSGQKAEYYCNVALVPVTMNKEPI